jgi:hypothetical protein
MSVTAALLVIVVPSCAAVAAFWYWTLCRRRRRRQEWEATAAGLRDLDRELDELWASERLRGGG